MGMLLTTETKSRIRQFVAGLGYPAEQRYFGGNINLGMYVSKMKNRSGTTSIVVVEKRKVSTERLLLLVPAIIAPG